MSGQNDSPKYLIGIGASAGGLEPLQELISHLPKKINDVAIIVAQHLSPNYKSMLVELLGRKTSLPIREARSGVKLKANQIYIVPPDNNIIIEKGEITFSDKKSPGPKPNIDQFFISIANEFGSKATGIILSGTGSDGSKGITAIKNYGGITIAQLPETAKYNGMPNAAINTKNIDHLMKPGEIGRQVLQIVQKQKISTSDVVHTPVPDSDPEGQIIELLENRVGTNFSNYKSSTMHRRLNRRMADKKFTDVKQYLEYIKKSPEELDHLFQYMLIGVTSFFRNPEVFHSVRDVLEEIISSKAKDGTLRLWIAGCASGEEAYSYAILICELFEKSGLHHLPVQIFATDIDQNALRIARNGIYDASKLELVSDDILNDYFIKKGDRYEVITKLKKMILFTRHDILNNPPFLRMDLVSCRNMLIYFNQALQKHIFPIFHYSLNAYGYLILGKSESIGQSSKYFSAVDSKTKIFQRKSTESKSMLRFPHVRPVLTKNIQSKKDSEKKINYSIPEMVKETLYSTMDFPYVVVDENLDMVEISGDISAYVFFKSGSANTNILKQINQELQIELRAVTSKAMTSGEAIKGNLRKLKIDDQPVYLRFIVKPLLYSQPNNPYYLIIFQTYDIDDEPLKHQRIIEEDQGNPRVLELEHELNATKEHMNTLIEELEASNEELQALNEELQSSNEELQASNEELETSNEELQATNEELETAYAQLNAAAEEIEGQNKVIRQSENNLKTILNNTLQAFILVDKNYNILTFNETAQSMYQSLFGKDIKEGMSYVDLISNEHFEKFRKSFRKALNGEVVASEQVFLNLKKQKKYFLYNYTPVEKNDKNAVTDYVCISFIDDTARKKAELELLEAHEETEQQKNKLEDLITNAPAFIAIHRGPHHIFEFVNPMYQQILGNEPVIGKSFEEAYPTLYKQGFGKIMDEVFSTGKPFIGREIPMIFDDREQGEHVERYFTFIYQPWNKKSGEVTGIINYAFEVTDQVKARKTVEENMKHFRLLTEAMPQKVWTADKDGNFDYLNATFLESIKTYFSGEADDNKDWMKYLHKDDRKVSKNEWKKCIDSGTDFKIQHRIKDVNGKYKWHLSYGIPLKDNGKIIRWIGISTDIHEQKSTERVKEQFISIASHELKTPLTAVKAYIELLKKHLSEQADETSILYISKTNENINKLNDLILDLLDISRIESGKINFKVEEVDFDEIAENAIENINYTSNGYSIKLTGKSGKKVRADKQRLEQVFLNLISNAIKYSPESKEILVDIVGNKDSVHTIIKDHGIGIPKNKLTKIFNRFYRASEEDRNFSGLGLGLFISKEIIDRHNGKIWAESEEGKGSEFHFIIPSVN